MTVKISRDEKKRLYEATNPGDVTQRVNVKSEGAVAAVHSKDNIKLKPEEAEKFVDKIIKKHYRAMVDASRVPCS
jgi:hypothetical protein